MKLKKSMKATYDEAAKLCSSMNMKLMIVECLDEWMDLLQATANISTGMIRQLLYNDHDLFS
jgi:hypothetical protein